MLKGSSVKPIAFYFPQFHPIPENDEWWGPGFTDWDNVKKARPQFKGHYQPRIPLGGKYYDQTDKEVIKWQIGLARAYGIHGFCHYHYWFEGKQLLEKPTNVFLESKELDFPFCLAWANETWSRRWDGRDHHILVAQAHTPDEAKWQAHFDYLIKAWTDERAIKIDGRPVFVIYRPQRISEIGRMFDFWRKKASERGLKGIYFIAIKQFELPDEAVLAHFDAAIQFQPFEAIHSHDFTGAGFAPKGLAKVADMVPDAAMDVAWKIRNQVFGLWKFYDYDAVWSHIVKERKVCEKPAYPGAFMDWDNSPRYGARATIFKGANPERFEYWFRKLVEMVSKRPVDDRFIFINAWNEWAEGTYLEPDEKYRYKYLEAIKRCVEEAGPVGA